MTVANLVYLMLELILIEAVLASLIYGLARLNGLRPGLSQIPLLLVPALLPFASAVWSQVFGAEPSFDAPSGVSRPDWIVGMFRYLFYGSIAAGVVVVALAKGYRVPAAIFATPQIFLTYVIGFAGTIGVTGTYL